jgi:NADPH-dependent curcumin reductase CurA
MRAASPGDVLPGGGVGRVLTGPLEGSLVTGDFGWRSHWVGPASGVTVVEDLPGVELHHHVGLLGLSGLTAFFGVTRVLRPQPGERIVVSGAYGGVGQVAVQLAVAAGASVAAIASGKSASLAALGATPLDRRSDTWVSDLAAWAPDGVDGYFDNVWGDVSARVVEQLRPLGRIALCGQMTGLTAGGQVPPLDIDWYLILTRSLTLQGFRTVDYLADYAAARKEIAALLLEGRLTQEVEVFDGLDSAGDAFTRLTSGQVVGKAIVRVV